MSKPYSTLDILIANGDNIVFECGAFLYDSIYFLILKYHSKPVDSLGYFPWITCLVFGKPSSIYIYLLLCADPDSFLKIYWKLWERQIAWFLGLFFLSNFVLTIIG
jgi:hypothetical protein